jgi:hypothetical protein
LSLKINIFSLTIYNPIKQCALNLFTAIATQRVRLTVEVLPTIGKTQDREDANESYFCCSQHAENHSDLNDQNLFHPTIDEPPGVTGVSKNPAN